MELHMEQSNNSKKISQLQSLVTVMMGTLLKFPNGFNFSKLLMHFFIEYIYEMFVNTVF